ncbi:interleukin-11 receptor subunit alpha [Eucyclogobius newberryi]|uniref:interleukin-11 receptor subunit alpha n=1 Tax=Eucyclogobius newberryi TaxID=166745 RepID=UPI003B5AE7F6
MPGLWSSPVCLTVICFLSWSLAPSRAQNGKDEVSGLQYGRLESNVTLACGKSPIRTPVVWHLNHSSELPWHQVTSNGSLILLQTDHSAQGDYSCYDNQGLLVHSLRLRLGYPPGELSISCRVPSHKHVRCSWADSTDTHLPSEYTASYGGNNQEEDGWRPCVVDASGKVCDIYHPGFWQVTHILQVTETNALGSSTTQAFFKLHELLKPDPPESVVVDSVEGYRTRLMVSWSFPSSWPQEDAFPLMFHVRYRPQGSSYWSELFSEEGQLTIFDALAGHVHQVEVRARDEFNQWTQWSEWSDPGFERPWEDDSTLRPTEEVFPEEFFPSEMIPVATKPATSTAKSQHPEYENEGSLGLVILLVLFSVVILSTVLSLAFVMWVKQRRRNQANKQELSSMVKMKSMSI